MLDDTVQEYIVTMIARGHTGQEIRHALLEHGYTMENVNRYLTLETNQISLLIQHMHAQGAKEQQIIDHLHKQGYTVQQINDALYPKKIQPVKKLVRRAHLHGVQPSTLIMVATAFVFIVAMLITMLALYGS